MRRLEQSSQFKKDFKREARGTNAGMLADLVPVLVALCADLPLDAKYQDHPLTGDKKDLRDCHIRPDLVLLYGKPDAQTLFLARLGSHSDIF